MSDRPLKILLIDQDPIFRLGLRVALEEMADWQVVAEVETETAALQRLAEFAHQDPNQVNLVVLELGNGRSLDSQLQSLQLCRLLKSTYPTLPILLLSSVQNPEILTAAKVAGINGYLPKGTPISQIIAVIAEVATGDSYWVLNTNPSPVNISPPPQMPLLGLWHNQCLSGINYINDSLAKVTLQLQTPGLPILERAVLAGQRRELLAAHWLLNKFLSSSQQRQQLTSSPEELPFIPLSSSAIVTTDVEQPLTLLPDINPINLQFELFSTCINKLQSPLENVADVPLEIDILYEAKKRDLLYLILQKLATQLDSLRAAQITIEQLEGYQNTILFDVWQATVTDFFGKFSQVQVGKQSIAVVNVLLQNPRVIQTEILNKIPFVLELFSYLLFQTDLYIDNHAYLADSDDAKSQALIILENLLIQVGNGVLQPLLNYLADVEAIKKNFYTRKLISTREIERFRNELSWKYRLNNYVNEAKAIFESRYELFVLAPRGIAKTSIYAPRNAELAKLSGVPLLVTLGLEFWDAIAPRLQSLLSFLGSGIVFVLTQIIGRGLGLIGRGILQGIGSVSFQDKNFNRNSERPK
ncbi:response regulator receiver domain protein [Anabaenopsis circularis NIES-21]|uniref:Response regulator receiver domain protein n=1 Tax=Anabaenopsis circularis NIES-21 TaxID=1085406 RepID=A0A1Z4GPI0_9CYAN|nr:response regulator receiver domain protein [Anabaenopsis circularis NIES-21]